MTTGTEDPTDTTRTSLSATVASSRSCSESSILRSGCPGEVSQILPAGDPQTHTFTMKVDLPRTGGLKSGMFGRLRLEKGVSTTLLLPKSTFIERGDLASLFVVGSDRVARLRWVKIGRTLEQGVEVLSGVDQLRQHSLASGFGHPQPARGILQLLLGNRILPVEVFHPGLMGFGVVELGRHPG